MEPPRSKNCCTSSHYRVRAVGLILPSKVITIERKKPSESSLHNLTTISEIDLSDQIQYWDCQHPYGLLLASNCPCGCCDHQIYPIQALVAFLLSSKKLHHVDDCGQDFSRYRRHSFTQCTVLLIAHSKSDHVCVMPNNDNKATSMRNHVLRCCASGQSISHNATH